MRVQPHELMARSPSDSLEPCTNWRLYKKTLSCFTGPFGYLRTTEGSYGPMMAIPNSGGEGGIRTRGGILSHTRFPGVRLKPLIHLSRRGRILAEACLITKQENDGSGMRHAQPKPFNWQTTCLT